MMQSSQVFDLCFYRLRTPKFNLSFAELFLHGFDCNFNFCFRRSGYPKVRNMGRRLARRNLRNRVRQEIKIVFEIFELILMRTFVKIMFSRTKLQYVCPNRSEDEADEAAADDGDGNATVDAQSNHGIVFTIQHQKSCFHDVFTKYCLENNDSRTFFPFVKIKTGSMATTAMTAVLRANMEEKLDDKEAYFFLIIFVLF